MNQTDSKLLANTAMNPLKTIGLELEYHDYSNSAKSHMLARKLNERGLNVSINLNSHLGGFTGEGDGWHIKRDGTRGRFPIREIVSTPMCAEKLFFQLYILTEVIRELNEENLQAYRAENAEREEIFSVDRDCGLHVHFDAKRYNEKRLRYMVNNWVKNENNFLSIIAPSRRNNGFCRTFAPHLDDSLNYMQCEGERYHHLNLNAYRKHKTIEIRSHQGTLNFAKIVYWTAFCQGIVESSLTSVKRTAGYNNPMCNYLLQGKWATRYRPSNDAPWGLLAKNDASQALLFYVSARMNHFGVQAAPVIYDRNEVQTTAPSAVDVVRDGDLCSA